MKTRVWPYWVLIGLFVVAFLWSQFPSLPSLLLEAFRWLVRSGIILGVLSSLGAAWIYSRVTKGQDIQKLNKELADLRRDHDALLKAIVPAIGGNFTESLFAFHPMASKRIASILSGETKRQYERHHKRVVVKRAEDTYVIREVKRISGTNTVVWRLDFHILWEWWNDSESTKFPLEDLCLVIDANEGSLDSFTFRSEAEKKDQLTKRAEYFERENIVRSIVVNPRDPTIQIPPEQMAEV